MSQENVEVARQVDFAFNRRDVAHLLDQLDPEVEWIPTMAVLEGRVYHGHDGVRRWIEDLGTDWELFEQYSEEVHDLGDRVLVLGGWRTRGVAGVNRPAWLYYFRQGKIVRLETYIDRAEALEAARLGSDRSRSRGESASSA
jgi:ketosteroid isomerase-like protein